MDRNNLKFTASANPEAEALLRKALEGIRSDIAALNLRGLAGVYLGGGYGRGEGGVFCKNGTVRLYNDLDFFPVGTGLGKTDKAHIDSALREVSRKWHAELGIDVDFGPVKNSSELKRSARTLMFQELRHGFVTICGSDDALTGAVPVLAPEQLPLMEAVRLMLNRGMGLLFAGEKLASHSGDTGFILRNWNKCILGCGDAFLIADKGYLWHVEERRERLLELAAPVFSLGEPPNSTLRRLHSKQLRMTGCQPIPLLTGVNCANSGTAHCSVSPARTLPENCAALCIRSLKEKTPAAGNSFCAGFCAPARLNPHRCSAMIRWSA